MDPHSRLVRSTLFICIFLYVATETFLSPFYPQFFLKVFRVPDLEYTGWYIFLCRLTVLLSAPLWGVAARHIEVKHLLFLGQTGAGVLTILLANTATATDFLTLSILLVALKSSYLLLYPLLVQLTGQEHSPALAARYQGVFHAAIIVSTILGVWAVLVPSPLHLFYIVALTDLIQLPLCYYALRGVSTAAIRIVVTPSPVIHNRMSFVAAFGFVIVTFHLANNIVRPYFTAYLMDSPGAHLSLLSSGMIFLIPSIMALVAMPSIRLLCAPDRLYSVYLVGMALLAISLFLQTWTDNIIMLVLGRLLYGFFVAVTQAALEVRLLMGSRLHQLHTNYTWAASAQNMGLLSAPLLASSLVDLSGMAAPLFAAALLCLFNLALAGMVVFRFPLPTWNPATPTFRKDSP